MLSSMRGRAIVVILSECVPPSIGQTIAELLWIQQAWESKEFHEIPHDRGCATSLKMGAARQECIVLRCPCESWGGRRESNDASVPVVSFTGGERRAHRHVP